MVSVAGMETDPRNGLLGWQKCKPARMAAAIEKSKWRRCSRAGCCSSCCRPDSGMVQMQVAGGRSRLPSGTSATAQNMQDPKVSLGNWDLLPATFPLRFFEPGPDSYV